MDIDIKAVPEDQELSLKRPFVWGGNQDYELTYLGLAVHPNSYAFKGVHKYNTAVADFYVTTDLFGWPTAHRNTISRVVNVPLVAKDHVVIYKDSDNAWYIVNRYALSEAEADKKLKDFGNNALKIKVPV